MKGFELVLHRKKDNLFERRLLVCKVSASPFPSGDIQGACNVSK